MSEWRDFFGPPGKADLKQGAKVLFEADLEIRSKKVFCLVTGDIHLRI